MREPRYILPMLLLLGSACALPGPAAHAREKRAPKLSPLRVVGTELRNRKGEIVRLTGVNAASMEWSSDGEGHILTTVQTAIRDWHVNIIRLPLTQDRWFGKAPEQKDEGKAYRAQVKQIVQTCAAQNCYILLDLHWNDMGEWGQRVGQHVMPDANSVLFWKSCAAAYKNHPAVLFDLYNEPHDVSWSIWRNGGTVTEKDRKQGDKTYEAVGMQALLDAVRSTGAKNVIVAGGLDWAYDYSGILSDGPLADPKGNGVVYANHAYPFKGENVSAWTRRMETASAKLPVIVSEFGSEPSGGAGQTGEQWVRSVLQIIEAHKWNYTAWDMHPGASPCLIADWNYTPTNHFGVPVLEVLKGTLQPYAPAPSLPSASP